MTRNAQREQAFYLLFEKEFQKEEQDLIAIYDENIEVVCDYAKELYLGVCENMDKLDEIITKYSKGWKLQRLPKVTLCILRLAIYEMTYVDEVPSNVAINEAVEFSKKYSSKDDSSFVNGILGSYSRSED